MYKQPNNYAFIDSINLHLTFDELGWKIDYGKFRNLLRKKYNVTKAYYFIGLIHANQPIYKDLKAQGYSLKFRDVLIRNTEYIICHKCGQIYEADTSKFKCDCDADIVLQIMNDINNFDKAIFISSDGDFDHLIEQLLRMGKLELVLAPCKRGCSYLLLKAARGRIAFVEDFRAGLEKI